MYDLEKIEENKNIVVWEEWETWLDVIENEERMVMRRKKLVLQGKKKGKRTH